jgi:hypothetical protein
MAVIGIDLGKGRIPDAPLCFDRAIQSLRYRCTGVSPVKIEKRNRCRSAFIPASSGPQCRANAGHRAGPQTFAIASVSVRPSFRVMREIPFAFNVLQLKRFESETLGDAAGWDRGPLEPAIHVPTPSFALDPALRRPLNTIATMCSTRSRATGPWSMYSASTGP